MRGGLNVVYAYRRQQILTLAAGVGASGKDIARALDGFDDELNAPPMGWDAAQQAVLSALDGEG